MHDQDVPWAIDPEGTPSGAGPGQINCGYFLDEITMENGPIVVVPGSHRALFKPPVDFSGSFPDEVYVMAKPGQAVMFDGCTYHRGAANTSPPHPERPLAATRRVCLMCYQPAWMKSREPFDGPFAKRLREHGTVEQKLLLGAMAKW